MNYDSVKIARGKERFWVTVESDNDGMLRGHVNNILIGRKDHGLSFGDEIDFHESEIIETEQDALDALNEKLNSKGI